MVRTNILEERGKGVVRTLLGVVRMKLEGHEWMEYSIKQKL